MPTAPILHENCVHVVCVPPFIRLVDSLLLEASLSSSSWVRKHAQHVRKNFQMPEALPHIWPPVKTDTQPFIETSHIEPEMYHHRMQVSGLYARP